MSGLIFSQSAVFQLQQLAKVVRYKTGVKHRLSDPKSVNSLLRFSSTSSDVEIFELFSRFTQRLDEAQIDDLNVKGLMLPSIVMDKVVSNNEHLRAG